ncbi:MAG: extracellular solute-binding protein [Armatimonadetes bacterium]|nr:extracellular solute-binding protein [Armatimonadota bacterium]
MRRPLVFGVDSGRLKNLLALALALTGLTATAQQTVIRMMAGPAFGIPPKDDPNPRNLTRRAVFDEFHRQNPDVRVVNAGGLEMVGDQAEVNFLMSMAGDTAPDVFYVNFRQYFNYIDQGFCRPLDDLLDADPDSKRRVLPEVEKVLRHYDGRMYAMPFYQVAQALYYRKDHFREAGLDPNEPPQDWEQFLAYGRKLTERGGRNGFVFEQGLGGKGYWWTNFVWQAGGEVLQPADRGYSRAVVGSPEAAKALDFYRRLVRETWTGADGKTYGPVASISSDWSRDVREGRISMWFAYTNDVLLSISDLPPSQIGVAALPAGPAGRANEINSGMWAVSSQVKDPKKIEACWRFIKFFVSQEAARVQTEKLVELGLGSLVNPVLLKKFGHSDIAEAIDPGYVEANVEVWKTGHPEPYGRNSQQVYEFLDLALDRAKLQDTPSLQILKDVEAEMNKRLLGYIEPQELAAKRQTVAISIGFIGIIGLILGITALRKARRTLAVYEDRLPAGSDRKRVLRFVAACLLPAGLSMLVWAYYPLLAGLVIGFQDYRIVQGTKWVGLDNFVSVLTQPVFYHAVLNSFLYVLLTIGIGFLLPVALAVALNEITRFQLLFRTLFYLPAMTSGVVISFLWRQIYDKKPEGLLNQLVAPFAPALNPVLDAFHGPHLTAANDWLGDPKLALLAVVIPGIWAGAGPGSILYLAALKNIPDERYEAADLDGASWVQKLWRITMPGLKPLMLINLLGVFIGGFKAMDNVFILTKGGPLYATHTIGLEVWKNAFMYLKFGYATAAAWVMGAILIGFTVTQIRYLTRLRFGTAKV